MGVWGLLALGLVSGVGAALAGWLLTAPQTATPGDFLFADKLWHFLAFACLTAPGCLALDRRGRRFWCAHMLALAVGSEIVQAVSGQGRSGDPIDASRGSRRPSRSAPGSPSCLSAEELSGALGEIRDDA